VRGLFDHTVRLHQQTSMALAADIVGAAAAMSSVLRAGGRVLVFGNGGSAADAQHFAAELVGRFERERRPLAAIALSTDTSVLTSIGNDEGFERIFARQVEALGAPGDVAFGITTSGRSPNVLRAFVAARARQMKTIALTGSDGGEVAPMVDVHLNVGDRSTPRVQEVHTTVLHALCALIEREL
jgi:D-sedoheptulose 7-phosphate isomerase